MRISQKTEWALIAVVIAYMAFMSGFQPVRELLGSSVGKAIGLAVVVATWKYVSPIVAVLLSIEFVRVAVLREHATNPSPPPTITPSCPENYTLENGQCKNKQGETMPMSTSSGTPPPGTSVPPSTNGATGGTPTKENLTLITPGVVAGGYQPDSKETFLAPANF